MSSEGRLGFSSAVRGALGLRLTTFTSGAGCSRTAIAVAVWGVSDKSVCAAPFRLAL